MNANAKLGIRIHGTRIQSLECGASRVQVQVQVQVQEETENMVVIKSLAALAMENRPWL